MYVCMYVCMYVLYVCGDGNLPHDGSNGQEEGQGYVPDLLSFALQLGHLAQNLHTPRGIVQVHYIHTYIHTYIHIHKYIHTYLRSQNTYSIWSVLIHIYIHTYIHE